MRSEADTAAVAVAVALLLDVKKDAEKEEMPPDLQLYVSRIFRSDEWITTTCISVTNSSDSRNNMSRIDGIMRKTRWMQKRTKERREPPGDCCCCAKEHDGDDDPDFFLATWATSAKDGGKDDEDTGVEQQEDVADEEAADECRDEDVKGDSGSGVGDEPPLDDGHGYEYRSSLAGGGDVAVVLLLDDLILGISLGFMEERRERKRRRCNAEVLRSSE